MGILAQEDEKRRNIDLALQSARSRLSPQTGFVHLFLEDPCALDQDTIPIVENFYYVLALFRSKTIENIQEGKNLLQKLLAFVVGGNFPIYLHEYPVCKDSELSSHLLAPLFYLLKDFSSVLGEDLVCDLTKLRSDITSYLQSKSPISMGAKSRLLASLGEWKGDSVEPEGPLAWAEWCICAQMMGVSLEKAAKQWDVQRGVFIGEAPIRYQEGMEPAITLLDLFMGQYYRQWSARVLHPHIVHIRAAIIQQMDVEVVKTAQTPYTLLVEKEKRQCLTLYFGDLTATHSVVVEAKKGSWEKISSQGSEITLVYLPEEILPSEEESMECAIYVDASPSLSVQVLGVKATTFRAKEELTISSSFCKIGVTFEGEQGEWLGHILKANRSYQKKTEGYSAYDWKLGWRTLRRSPNAKVYIHLTVSE